MNLVLLWNAGFLKELSVSNYKAVTLIKDHEQKKSVCRDEDSLQAWWATMNLALVVKM